MRVLSIDELKLKDSTAAINLFRDKKSITVLFGEKPYRITGVSIKGCGMDFKYSLRLKQCDGAGKIVLKGSTKEWKLFSYGLGG